MKTQPIVLGAHSSSSGYGSASSSTQSAAERAATHPAATPRHRSVGDHEYMRADATGNADLGT
jgi:hypothetical protein